MNHTPILPDLLNDPAVREADAKAVMDQLISGKPLDSLVASRVRERSRRATEALRRKFGVVDAAVGLIRETRDEA